MERTFSLRWKVAAVLVGCLIGAATFAGIQQGLEDGEAKQALEASIRNDARIEAARVERVMQINRINQAQCAAIRNVYKVIRETVAQSDRNIRKIQYYRDHPSERKFVHAQNQKTLALFREPPCPPDVLLPVRLNTVTTP